MKVRTLKPRTRSHLLSTGLFLIGLSVAASVTAPAIEGDVEAHSTDRLVSEGQAAEAIARPVGTEKVAVTVRAGDCPSAG